MRLSLNIIISILLGLLNPLVPKSGSQISQYKVNGAPKN